MNQATAINVPNEPSEHGRSASSRVGLPIGERRHSFRVRVPGKASVWRKGKLHGHYLIEDLCIEGCSLRAGAVCAVCHHGEHVELVLHLQNCPAIWLPAQVTRAAGGSLALHFDRTSARVEDCLQDVVVEAYARAHLSERFVLVIEPRSALRQAIIRQLETIGERALGAITPLDAVQLLMERAGSFHTALIGPQADDQPNTEIAEFLALAYPRVRRVLMGDAQQLADSWLVEATGEVDGLLEVPCSEEALRRLMQRVSALPHEPAS